MKDAIHGSRIDWRRVKARTPRQQYRILYSMARATLRKYRYDRDSRGEIESYTLPGKTIVYRGEICPWLFLFARYEIAYAVAQVMRMRNIAALALVILGLGALVTLRSALR